MNSKTLIEKRNQLMQSAGTIMQGDTLTSAERESFDKIMSDVDVLNDDIKRAERSEAFEAEQRNASRPPRSQPGDVSGNDVESEKRAFKNYITGRLTADDHQHLRTESRDLTVGAAGAMTGGGVLVPTGYDSLLHTATKSIGEILDGVRTWNTDTGEGIRVSLADPTAQRFVIVGEGTALGESDPSLAGFTSNVDTLGLMTKVSNQLLQDSAFSIEQFLSDTISAAWVRTASDAIIKGNSSCFQSLVAAAPVGYTMPTGGTTSLTYDSIIGFYSQLDPSYLPGAAFWCNSKTWASMLEIKDNFQRPILTSNLQGSPFRTLLGLPIRISQSLDDLGAGLHPLLLGDAAQSYTYRQAGPLVIRKSVDRFLEFNTTAFACFQRAGGYSTIQSSSPSMLKLTMAAS